MVSLIVAMDKDRVVGIQNQLPWHLPADLKRFKTLTTGHFIIMGRKTFESIGRALPRRTNVVVTRQRDYKAEGCEVVGSLSEALRAAQADSEAFIIGGAELYSQALEFVDKLYITELDVRVSKGDAYFPAIDSKNWKLVEESPGQTDPKSGLRYRYLTYVKKT